ncbi:hypothetical protein MTR67_006289 [Solanum verrucosum]|uniref:Autophagy-related protein 2 n=1 Tax=Solanum verrucosum TaxID=315347 RepID=A0AAF0Q3S0_SOLVR|nr:hypothetical protein MTR67_006289 [Solanum verrucosum]
MWKFARSAEKLFSRWAIKRFCKFWLKKKLGKFILGDIDLDQLDVQARAGIIQLTDLALNVDYLNQKIVLMNLFYLISIYLKEISVVLWVMFVE